MKKQLRVLIIEDSQADAELNVALLQKAGYEITYQRVESAEEMAKAVIEPSWDVILSDYSMPGFSVLAALKIYHARGIDIPFIVISGTIGEEKAVQLIKAGVHEYYLKSNMASFAKGVERELRESAVRREVIKLNTALANSQEKYRSYIDHAPDGVFVTDETGKYLEVNDAACRITGYSKEELMKMSISDILPEEFVADGLEHFRKLAKTGTAKADLVYRHKDGTNRWWVLEAVKLNETRFLGFAKDITTRKEMEENLRTHQVELEMQNDELTHAKFKTEIAVQKYTELYDFAPSAYFTLSKEQTILELNHSGARMLAMERLPLINRHFTLFVSEKTRPVFHAFLQSVFKIKTKQICEIVLKTADNQLKNVHIEGVFINDGKECLINVVDFTKRKQTEDALKEASTRLELASRANRTGVWDLDIVSHRLIWDDYMFELYGVDKMKFRLAYETWQALIHPDDLAHVNAEIGDAMKGKREFNSEFRVCWPDGTIHNIKGTAVVLRDHAGKPLRCIGTNWDITDEKLLEEKLKTSEANFRTFFETINDMIVVGSMTGEILYVNRAYSVKLGYTPEEFHAMKVIDLNPESLRAEAEQIFGEMFTGKRDYCPLPLARKDGTLVPVETRVWFGKWNGQDCIFGFSKDLTVEQEALQKFNKIFDKNPTTMAITSLTDGVFTDVNEMFLMKTGYSREEVIGKTAIDLDLFIQPEQHAAASGELEKSGSLQNLELKVKTRSGKILEGLFFGEIIETQGKQLFLTVMVDVTEQKQAEEEIHRAKSFLNSILENIPNMIFLKDSRDLSFIQFNRAGEELLGISRDELLGKSDYHFFSKEQADYFTGKDREVLKSKSMTDIPEEPIQTKSQGTRILHTKKVPILDGSGEPEYLLGISEDITDRKQTEEVIRKSESNLALAQRIAHLGSWEWDMASNKVKWSKEMHRIFDITAEEFDGKPEYIIQVLHPDDIELFTNSMNSNLAGENSPILEYRIIRKDGTVRNLVAEGKTFYDQTGEAVKIIGTV